MGEPGCCDKNEVDCLLCFPSYGNTNNSSRRKLAARAPRRPVYKSSGTSKERVVKLAGCSCSCTKGVCFQRVAGKMRTELEQFLDKFWALDKRRQDCLVVASEMGWGQ
jgi:hypothetical protein